MCAFLYSKLEALLFKNVCFTTQISKNEIQKLSKITPENNHLRHCMLYEFRKRKKATGATAAICSVYGEDALSVRVCQQWFIKFRNNNFDLEDEQRPGNRLQFMSNDLQALLDENP